MIAIPLLQLSLWLRSQSPPLYKVSESSSSTLNASVSRRYVIPATSLLYGRTSSIRLSRDRQASSAIHLVSSTLASKALFSIRHLSNSILMEYSILSRSGCTSSATYWLASAMKKARCPAILLIFFSY